MNSPRSVKMAAARRKYTPRRYTRRRYGRYRRPSYSYRRRPVRRTRRAAASTKCHCPQEMTPQAKFALAQLDPFDPKCLGAKIPDSNTMPSIANADTDIVNISTSAVATNLNGTAFRPSYTWGTIAATAGASLGWGAAWSTNASNRNKRTQYTAAIELTRPVAHAVRLSSPLAPTSATGFVHIGLSTETVYNEVTWQFPATLADMSGLQYYKRVTLASLTQSPLTIINKWIDDTAFRYSSPTASIDATPTQMMFQTDYSWGVIVVVLEGAPTSVTALSCEHLLLSEGIPRKDSVIIGSVAAPNSPETLAAVSSMATTQEPFHTEAEQETYIQRGVNAIGQGVAQHGESLFQQVAVPLLQQAGAGVVNAGAQILFNAVVGRGGIAGVNNNAHRLEL